MKTPWKFDILGRCYYEDEFIRVEFFGDEVESITKHEYLTNNKTQKVEEVIIYSVNPFVVSNDKLAVAVKQIEEELHERLGNLKEHDKLDNSGDFIQYLINQKPVFVYVIEGPWYDIGSKEELNEADIKYGGLGSY